MRVKKLLVIAIMLVLILTSANVKATTSNILEVVKINSTTKNLEENQGTINKKVSSFDSEKGEVTIQLELNNTASKVTETEHYDNTEIYILLGESIVKEDEKLNQYISYIKTLATQVFKKNENTKIGILGMKGTVSDMTKDENGNATWGPNDESNVPGTADNAEIVVNLTNDIGKIENGIRNMNSAKIEYRYNLQAAVRLAKNSYSSNVNKMLISLYDNVPSIAIGVKSQVSHGILTPYDTVEEAVIAKHQDIVKNTKNDILSLKTSNISFILLRPDDTSFDETWYNMNTGEKTLDFDGSPYVKELYGTLENPTYGKMYSLDNESLEKIVTENIFVDIMEEIGKDMQSVEVKDYFPKDIVDNFTITISENNKNEVDTTNLKTDRYIKWNMGNLVSGQKKVLEYTMKINNMQNSDLIDKIISTNEKVECTYVDYNSKQKTANLADSPQIKLVAKKQSGDIPNVNTNTSGDTPSGNITGNNITGGNNNGSNTGNDNTVAPGVIPQTGESIILFGGITIILIIGIISMYKYRKNIDIK